MARRQNPAESVVISIDEEPELFLHMLANDLLVQGDAEAGRVRYADIAILNQGRFVDEGIPEWLIQMVELEDEEVRYGGHNVTSSHGLDRAADIVRGNRDIIQVREIGDPSSLQQAASFGQIRGNDIRALFLHEGAEAVPGIDVFAGANRRAR